MRKTLPLHVLSCLVPLLTACGGAKEERTKEQEMMDRIQAMEDSLFKDAGGYDERNALALLDVYKAYAATFPADSLAPECVFRAARVATSMRDHGTALALFDRIIRDYPSWYRAPDALFMKAFVIDEMGQTGEARRAYQEFVGMFPDHPFADDARQSIENLGMSTEEWLERARRMEQEEQAEGAAAR